MIYGLGVMKNDPNEYKKIFIYNGLYYDEAGILKATKTAWTKPKDNRTKKKILNNVERWNELKAVGIEPQIAAELWEDIYVLTDGTVLRHNSALDTKGGQVRIMINGNRENYYVSDLLIHGFIDESYPVDARASWVIGKLGEANLDNVEIKDSYFKKKEKTNEIFDPLESWV